MNRHQKNCAFVLCSVTLLGFAASFKMEGRTGGLHIPEKILGVIDMVQQHKNKPVQGAQPTYPPNPQYNYQQYPQQWNGQSNFQNPGFQTQPQFLSTYQNQGQYNYQNGYNPAGNLPQDGGNYANHGNPAGSGQIFNQGQNQQGQYQGAYQNPNQFSQPNNQFQNTQSGYYPGQSNGQYQGSSNNFPGQSGQGQGQGGGSGHYNQGFMGNGGQSGSGNGQGPTCVCQVCPKPPEVFADSPATEKSQKKEEIST